MAHEFRLLALSASSLDARACPLPLVPPGSDCTLPGFKVGPVEGGGNCAQPMFWHGITIEPKDTSIDGVATKSYTALPPVPKPGHFTGYYVEIYFPSGV